ncbi:metallophosphoesterase family protein [Paeniroseomonas aquatica]|uniref:Metallophosphoesterase family protein n=1 Tax=Paeniroseomonas aquatica TaxID=373043 RepID=A0ABT8A084_9PROT|nr:metallophosphoesterase family protein [Paeniroseomonas aquatica]MDN3563130.1 metallophosphoesterase family protein [Paeniroseomonas aquatica]
MRIAVLADAHGNLLAFKAVLADMRTQAPDLIVNLGDLVTGPFDPAGSADAQIALGCPTLAGNHERNLVEGDDASSSVAFARPRLSATHMLWIQSLPKTLRLAGDEVFACHGSPAGGDLDYLLDDVGSGRSVLASYDVIRPRLAGIGSARLVLCGHTHMPRVVQVGAVTVVNPGSIGMPAYTDDNPVPHVIETGTPHARYAVVTRGQGGKWSVDLRAVVYDWDRAAQQARENGKPAMARWTSTGRV